MRTSISAPRSPEARTPAPPSPAGSSFLRAALRALPPHPRSLTPPRPPPPPPPAEKFEELGAPIFQRAAAPLRAVLDEAGVKVGDLANVELIGGGTRIPRVQALLQDVLGGRALDRHLDSDEAIVMGAGLVRGAPCRQPLVREMEVCVSAPRARNSRSTPLSLRSTNRRPPPT